jgi:hypothetical protein
MRVGHAATSLARIRSGRAAILAFITIMRHNCRPVGRSSLSVPHARPKSKDDAVIGLRRLMTSVRQMPPPRRHLSDFPPIV